MISESQVNQVIIDTISGHFKDLENFQIIKEFIEQVLQYEHLIWNQTIQGRDIIANYEKIIDKIIPEDI